VAQSLQAYEPQRQFDLIVTNPPFFSGGTLSDNSDRNRMRQTTKLSHQDLLSNVKRLLSPDGSFALILPPLEGLRFIEMASFFNLHCNRVTEIYPRSTQPVKRMLLNFSRQQPIVVERDSFEIDKGGRNQWTDAYIALTKDYHPEL
jgi:tRNA1Val (adenine37-N6)-methyltransferase